MPMKSQVNWLMPNSTDKKNNGKSIIDQVCSIVWFLRNFRCDLSRRDKQ